MPHPVKYKTSYQILADQQHKDEAESVGLTESVVLAVPLLQSFRKQKKVIRKWEKSFQFLLASDTLIRFVFSVIFVLI